jgi:plastocyanin
VSVAVSVVRRRAVVLLAAGALVLMSCGGDDDSGDEPTVIDAGEEAAVEARDNVFRPEEISVVPGTEVVWTNEGRSDHDIEPVEGDNWGIAPDGFGPDATYAHTFDEPGRYAYYCTLHGTPTRGMRGAVIVREQ